MGEIGVESNERLEAERFMKETEKAKDRRRNKYAYVLTYKNKF